jgi:hypothetical protein
MPALRTPFMPPHDPWLSGFAISYYYLGYLLLALVTRLTQIPPTIAFNLGNAGWFALVAVQAYGIVYDMLPRPPSDRAPRRRVTLRPLIAPVLLLITGNGVGLLEVLHARGLLPASFWQWLDIGRLSEAPQPPYSWVPQRFFWWWQASRTIRDYTPWGDPQEVIDEFPAFSFILGDMHPHLLALPFVLVAITLALHAYLAAREGPPARVHIQNRADAPSSRDVSDRTRSLSGWIARLTHAPSPSRRDPIRGLCRCAGRARLPEHLGLPHLLGAAGRRLGAGAHHPGRGSTLLQRAIGAPSSVSCGRRCLRPSCWAS